MLNRFAFLGKMLYLCRAKRRMPADTGHSPLFWPKMADVFPQRQENFSVRAENFSLRAENFSVQLVRARAFPDFFRGPQTIKNIKVVRWKKLGF